ncbi:MAG: HAMP domain-containing histidine kinase [Bdellovibrionales bacterium]|nr:HAMP domain-containing histidine kinase [Ramlibacter sp.]
MKVETTAPVHSQTEAQWVDGELIRSLMSNAKTSQYASLLLIPVVFGVLVGDVLLFELLLWVVAASAVSGYRLWSMLAYARDRAHSDAAGQLEFMRRNGFIWPLGACVWGLTSALHFDRAPVPDQFICWLILAGLAMFSINTFSAHLRTMEGYLNVLAVSLVSVMLWRMVATYGLKGPVYQYWLLVLVVIFWQLLLQAGRRLHGTHRRNFELQFRNAQLIDSLKRQTQAALDAVEIKNRFLASAAHDIRQPVHALGLYADWLGSEPELVREIAPKIVESTKAVNALFDSLFDLARLDSGKIRLSIEPVNMRQLQGDLELQYRPVAQAKGLALRVRIAPGSVMSDHILLQRTLGNLISNAIKYTAKGGVLVASRRRGGVMCIEVWDTGMGIAPQYQREIFREFYKVPSHGGTEDGFGLGLYIVARLTRILGHPLELSSRPGRGSMFRLVLQPTDPVQAAERAAASVAQLASIP